MKNSSAFPIQDGFRSEGMTLGAYAAIHLKRPCSGIDWLDEEIKESLRQDFLLAAYTKKGYINEVDRHLTYEIVV